MVRINSKTKGNTFERQIAKLFEEWSGYNFHRTPGSGALHWNNDTRVVSDIVPAQELIEQGWPFSIECKKVEYDWEFSKIIEGKSLFWSHWNQAYGDAEREGLLPMLVFSKNRREIYCVINLELYASLSINIDALYVDAHHAPYTLAIFKLKDLLENTTIEQVIKLKK